MQSENDQTFVIPCILSTPLCTVAWFIKMFMQWRSMVPFVPHLVLSELQLHCSFGDACPKMLFSSDQSV